MESMRAMLSTAHTRDIPGISPVCPVAAPRFVVRVPRTNP